MKHLPFFACLTALIVLTSSPRAIAQNAEVQIIHNCADPAADSVDIYVGATLAFDNFAFRNATAFLSLPTGAPLQVGIAPKTSSSVTDTLVSYSLSLTPGERYIAMATGVLSPGSFAANPDGRSTGFQLRIFSGIRSASSGSTDVDFAVMHGSTDAPTVDVVPMGSASVLVDNAAYGDITSYLTVPAASYTLNITPGSDNSQIVASYVADLSTLGGGAAVVFASGFLNPSINQSGAAFGVFAALPNGTVIELPANTSARLQIVHNCADPAAASVDIYLDTTLTLDDFNFRAATPFRNVPAGVQVNIGIAASTSSSVNDVLVSIPVTFQAGQTYIAVASGVIDSATFAPNPDGVNTGFQLVVKSGVTENSSGSSAVRFVTLHGSTDAPTVDAVLQSSPAPLIDGLSYTEFSSSLEVPAGAYILNITPDNDNATVVASYEVDLSAIGGSSALVFASGFLDPTSNQNGAGFGLFAALPNGTVVAFPATTTARLQIIHNCADSNADSVDIYLDSVLILNDFAFRTATPFNDIPAGTPIIIGIAPSNSSSVSDALVSIPVTLQGGQTYVAIASGVLTPADFALNPDSINTNFQLLLTSGVAESAELPTDVRFIAVHGATDAPYVDVIPQSAPAPLIDGISYTGISSTLNVPAASYVLNITPDNNNAAVVASYNVDLSSLGGASAVVFASGFLNPAANQNGPAFGLYAALTNGTVVAFPASTTARVQIIHNAADPIAATVDVYAGSNLLRDNFSFRTATPFLDLPAGVSIPVGIALSTSMSAADTIPGLGTTVNFTAGQTYVVVANGVSAPANFSVNPDGRSTAFGFFVKEGVRTASASSSDVDFYVLHGVTDAPAVDVIANQALTLVNDAAYGDMTGYLTVPAASYALDVTPAAGSPVVASFTADLSTLGGGAATVFASGFLTPANNQNGLPFGLFAALSDGTVVPFQNATGVSEMVRGFTRGIYPNPSQNQFRFMLNVDKAVNASLELMDMTGRAVIRQNMEIKPNQEVTMDVTSMPAGLYSLRIVSELGASATTVSIAR